MSFKKVTSLTMLWIMLVMTYTGIVLFIAPPGRVANWSNWYFLGLTKESSAQIHSTFMVLFIAMTLFHIFYNWKPLTSYMKNKTRQMVFFTKEMLIAVFLIILFIFGTLSYLPPFSTFLNFGESVKNSWEKEYGLAPYSHAELSSLKDFCRKLNFDLEKSKEILSSNKVIFIETQSLQQIAQNNKLSPQFIYNLLKKNFGVEGKIVQLSGLGKKSIEDVAVSLNISTQEFISKLKTLGIEAKKDDKFKLLSEKYNTSPMSILEKLGFREKK